MQESLKYNDIDHIESIAGIQPGHRPITASNPKDLKIDTEKRAKKAEEGELTPDSMSSRIDDSGIAMDTPVKGDLVLDRMGSRVEKVER